MRFRDRIDGFKKLGVFIGAVITVWATHPPEVAAYQTVYLAIGYFFGQGLADAGKYFNGKTTPSVTKKKAA